MLKGKIQKNRKNPLEIFGKNEPLYFFKLARTPLPQIHSKKGGVLAWISSVRVIFDEESEYIIRKIAAVSTRPYEQQNEIGQNASLKLAVLEHLETSKP